MSTFLTQVNGFTPVIDVVVADAGLKEALVYGMVWRYCRMHDGICRASTTTIGNRLDLSRRTVMRCLARLIELGYLEDKTPGLKNRPHVIADRGLVKIKGLIEVTDPTRSESHTARSESHSETPPLGQSDLVTRSESHMSRLYREEKEEETLLRDDGSSHKSKAMTQLQLDGIEWEMVKNDLALRMTASVFDTWVKPTTAHREGDTIVIQAHNQFAYEWLSMRLRPTIASAIKDTCGPKTTFEILEPQRSRGAEEQGP